MDPAGQASRVGRASEPRRIRCAGPCGLPRRDGPSFPRCPDNRFAQGGRRGPLAAPQITPQTPRLSGGPRLPPCPPQRLPGMQTADDVSSSAVAAASAERRRHRARGDPAEGFRGSDCAARCPALPPASIRAAQPIACSAASARSRAEPGRWLRGTEP